MLRAVLDPGVLIAALLSPDGTPARLVRAWLAGRFEMVVSPMLLGELERVRARPRLLAYASSEEARQYLDVFRRGALSVADPPGQARVTPDPGDDYLVRLARGARAEYLVSGDPHLTGLSIPDLRILTPRAFLRRLVEAPGSRG